jgi:hypothetical protein
MSYTYKGYRSAVIYIKYTQMYKIPQTRHNSLMKVYVYIFKQNIETRWTGYASNFGPKSNVINILNIS